MSDRYMVYTPDLAVLSSGSIFVCFCYTQPLLCVRLLQRYRRFSVSGRFRIVRIFDRSGVFAFIPEEGVFALRRGGVRPMLLRPKALISRSFSGKKSSVQIRFCCGAFFDAVVDGRTRTNVRDYISRFRLPDPDFEIVFEYKTCSPLACMYM